MSCKLLTRETGGRNGLGTRLIRCFQRFTMVVGVGNDRSIADCISGCRKAISIGQKLAEKEPLGLKYTQLIRFHTTACCQNITCVLKSRRNATFWSKVGKTGVGKMRVGEQVPTRVKVQARFLVAGSLCLGLVGLCCLRLCC